MANRSFVLYACAAALIFIAFVAPRSARAEDPPASFNPGYALAMTGAYFAAPVLGIAALQLHPALGIATFALVPPAVHLVYGDALWAGLSLIGPTASITAGVLLARLLQGDCAGTLASPFQCFDALAIGGFVGYLTWSAIDIIASATHRAPKFSARAHVQLATSLRGPALIAYGAF